jgi:hypothetical protein
MLPSRATIVAVFMLLVVAAATAMFFIGKQVERSRWLELENSDLREQRKEVSRLAAEVKEKQDAYNEAIADIRQFERRPTAGQLRHQELATLTARADADRLRALAAQAERDLEWTEAERSKFGIEAAEASAVAHALNNQKSNPSRPTPPTRPIQP